MRKLVVAAALASQLAGCFTMAGAFAGDHMARAEAMDREAARQRGETVPAPDAGAQSRNSLALGALGFVLDASVAYAYFTHSFDWDVSGGSAGYGNPDN